MDERLEKQKEKKEEEEKAQERKKEKAEQAEKLDGGTEKTAFFESLKMFQSNNPNFLSSIIKRELASKFWGF